MDKQLKELLTHPEMLGEVARQCKCERVEFTGELFQPVPYTMKATRGMPIEIEEKYYSKAYDVSVKMAQLTTNFNQYVVCNVPPTVMFKAKVFKPSRLCAVYQMFGGCFPPSPTLSVTYSLVDLSPEGRAAIADRVSKTSVSSSEPAAPPPSTDATPWTNIGSTLRYARSRVVVFTTVQGEIRRRTGAR